VPELPEVETIAADLRPLLLGRTVVACELRFPSIVRYPDPAHFAQRIAGRRIEEVRRRGKYIVIGLSPPPSAGEVARSAGGGGTKPSLLWELAIVPCHPLPNPPPRGEGTLHSPSLPTADALIIHLGMTGQLRCLDAAAAEPDHLHALFTLDDGNQLRYRDPRRFGRILLGTEEELRREGKLPSLGPEPIDPDFSADDLYQRLRHRRSPLKALLLDQRVVAGVGNIYADEACFQAKVRPGRAGGTLSRQAVARLRQALEKTLREAIDNRGSTVIDYRDARGENGRHQERLLVYGRAGEPCLVCGHPLSQTRLAGRTTVFCRRCQR
jgi:formamidopyrimidine-DNA glycosylase